jgi:hypothetical protein
MNSFHTLPHHLGSTLILPLISSKRFLFFWVFDQNFGTKQTVNISLHTFKLQNTSYRCVSCIRVNSTHILNSGTRWLYIRAASNSVISLRYPTGYVELPSRRAHGSHENIPKISPGIEILPLRSATVPISRSSVAISPKTLITFGSFVVLLNTSRQLLE